MADDILDPQNAAEDASETNAAAIALALDGASARPELSAAIAAFLKEQRRLMEEQREQLRDQVKRMRLGIVDQRFSIALKAMTALIGIFVAALFASMVWNARSSGGLDIEPFSVPSDLAARGLTSEVVAAKLLDKLSQMQAETTSQRAPQSFQNYWGQDIKVTIPDTGISLGELDRYLVLKFGHETRISGEIVRNSSGLAVTARSGTSGSVTASGGEGTFDSTMHTLAERVYRLTQPYLYGVWLQAHGRTQDALPVFIALAETGPIEERGWGYLGWSNCLEVLNGEEQRLAMLREGAEIDPRLFLLRQNMALGDDALGRPEEAIADGTKALTLLDAPGHGGTRDSVAPYSRLRMLAIVDANAGDFHAAASRIKKDFHENNFGASIFSIRALVVRALVGEHDLKAAKAAAATGGWGATAINKVVRNIDDLAAQMQIAAGEQDWARDAALGTQATALAASSPPVRTLILTRAISFAALANAKRGDFKTADALIAQTPDRCDICLRTRAQIAGLEQQYGRMSWWFARAVSENKSAPFADTDWGQVLMTNGDLDGAVAKFQIAHQKGPHFADPLEMWGEALIAKNRSDLALAKFEEAAKYAPNWKRLHQKWGEALSYIGRKDEAAKQFAIARSLDG